MGHFMYQLVPALTEKQRKIEKERLNLAIGKMEPTKC